MFKKLVFVKNGEWITICIKFVLYDDKRGVKLGLQSMLITLIQVFSFFLIRNYKSSILVSDIEDYNEKLQSVLIILTGNKNYLSLFIIINCDLQSNCPFL